MYKLLTVAIELQPQPEQIREMLHSVIDPELGVDIVELGLLRDVAVNGNAVWVQFTVTTPACPLSRYIEEEIRDALAPLDFDTVEVDCEMNPPWQPEDMSDAARHALGWPT